MRCVLNFVLPIVLFLNLGTAVAAVPPAGEFPAGSQDKPVAADKAPEAVPPGKKAAPWETPIDLMQLFYSKSTHGLIEVSALQREAGERQQALETLNQAANLAMESEVGESRHKTLSEIVSCLVQAGEFAEAESVAEKLEGEFPVYGKSGALLNIATAQIAAGFHQQALTNLQHAEEIAQKMHSATHKAIWLRGIALAQIEAGDKTHGLATLMQAAEPGKSSMVVRDLVAVGEFDRALELTQTIEETKSMLDMVNMIIAALIRDRQFQHALEVARAMDQRTQLPGYPSTLVTTIGALAMAGQWEQASQAAREMPPGRDQQSAFRTTAAVLAGKGQVDKAIELAQLINHDLDGFVSWEIVSAHIERGEFEQAQKMVESIKPVHHKVPALCRLVDALCAAGHFDQAVIVARKIEAENYFGTGYFSVVIQALCKAGDIDQAIELAHKIKSPGDKIRALLNIAEHMADTENELRASAFRAEAIEVAQLVSEPVAQAETFLQIASALSTAGEFKLAREVAETMVGPTRKEFALDVVAQNLAKAGEIDQAREVAEMIVTTSIKAKSLEIVALNLARDGEFDQALELARRTQRLNSLSINPEVLSKMSHLLTEAGEFTQAWKAAETIADAYAQVDAMKAIVTALTAAGEFSQAFEMAKKIPFEDIKVPAFCDIAKAQIEAGDKQQALATLKYASETVEIETNNTFFPVPNITYSRSGVLHMIARALISADAFQQAVEVIQKLDGRERIEMLAEAGAFEDALKAALKMDDVSQARINRIAYHLATEPSPHDPAGNKNYSWVRRMKKDFTPAEKRLAKQLVEAALDGLRLKE